MTVRSPTLVSVIIPCYEQGRYLGEAIESALSQVDPDLDVEIVVVDDGSTDSTSDVASAYGAVRYVRQENRGLSAARNKGFSVSGGSFVVFLDADDRLRRVAIASSLEILSSRPECAFVYGRHQAIDETGNPLPSAPQPSDAANIYRLALRGEAHPIHTPGEVLYRRRIIEEVGGFVEGLDGCADLHLTLRITQTAPACFNERLVLDHRLHPASMKKRSAYMLKTSIAVQRTQRDFVRAHREYEDDYRIGMRLAREYFGRHVAMDVARKAAGRDLRGALVDLAVLARYHPRGALPHLWRALRAVLGERLHHRFV